MSLGGLADYSLDHFLPRALVWGLGFARAVLLYLAFPWWGLQAANMIRPTSCSWLEKSQRVTLEMTSLTMLVGEGIPFFLLSCVRMLEETSGKWLWLICFVFFFVIFDNEDEEMTAKLICLLGGWWLQGETGPAHCLHGGKASSLPGIALGLAYNV